MKLFFDARYIRTDFHDGVSRYSTELATAVAALTPVTFIISDPGQLKWLPKDAKYIRIHDPTSIREPFTSLILNRYRPDVVFSPMQTMGSLGRRFKLILTLHDLIYYRHRTPPHYLSFPIRLLWRLYHATYVPQRLVLNRADIVATVSHTSKQDIIEAHLTKRPLVVVSNAPNDLSRFLKQPVSVKAAPPNLVYMGSFMNYKNVEALIAGMAFLPGRTLHLLSKIKPERKAQLQKCIPPNAHVVFHNGVSDEEYATLLADNAIVVTASRDEGYGLSLGEATAIGVPAVASDIAPHHEAAGKGALYFSPNNPQEFAKRVLELDDPKTIAALAKEGKQHSQATTWEGSARELLATIDQLSKR